MTLACETLEWTNTDKSDWEEGPWKSEPDKRQWTDSTTGLACLIVRGPSGALCGYVGVPEGHKYYLKDYDQADVLAHGGLTFSSMCEAGPTEADGICHIPSPGQSDHVWWLGFDCAHSGDKTPAPKSYVAIWNDYGDTYKDIDYVTQQVTSLASQLMA